MKAAEQPDNQAPVVKKRVLFVLPAQLWSLEDYYNYNHNGFKPIRQAELTPEQINQYFGTHGK